MLPLPLIDSWITRALEEDLGGGDLTSEALIPEQAWARAEAVAKAPLVLSGATVFSRVFHLVAPGSRVVQLVAEGAAVEAGTVLLTAEGRTRDLLAAERTALNFLQQLSGTATLTRRFVERLSGPCRITDTRKTVPGLRALQRSAVRHGGGHNHRDALGSAVMIKDNHIAAAGSIGIAVQRARALSPHTSRIEVEVSNLSELEEALTAGADIVMLDNFSDAELPAAVTQARGRALVEISGGITLERVPFLSSLGVDVLSVGALTHSAPAADISLRLWPVERDAPPLAESERVTAPLSAWFDAADFERLRVARGLRWGRPVRLLDVTPSTNDLALAAVASADKTGIVFLARQQLAGRGRRGNAWLSPAGENLTLSILIRLPGPPELAAGFSLLAGLAVRQVVAQVLGAPTLARVKWPNDVLIDGKKCAGILVESRRGPDGRLGVVLGVGLNVLTRDFPASLADATSLALSGAEPSRLRFEVLLVELLAALEERTLRYLADGLEPLLAELGRHDFLLGQRVRVGEAVGIADGVDDQGRLRLVQANGSVETALVGHVELLHSGLNTSG